MKRRALLLCMASAAGAGALGAGTGTLGAGAGDSAQEASSRELLALEEGAMERWRQGDPMGWAEIAAPEVTYLDPGLTKPIRGHAEYSAYLENLKGKIRYDVSEFIRPKVALHGGLAVMTYNYASSTRGADGVQKRNPSWNTTEVYARVDGAWRIVHSHWSLVLHQLPPSLELPLPVELQDSAPSGVLGELLAIERTAMDAWRRGNAFAFSDLSAPEVTYFDSGTPARIDGLPALVDEMRPRDGKIHYDVMEFLEPSVQVHGDAAVLFYRFLSTTLRQDGSIASRTPWNCTEVYAKQDGRWRIVHTHWSLIGGRSRS